MGHAKDSYGGGKISGFKPVGKVLDGRLIAMQEFVVVTGRFCLADVM